MVGEEARRDPCKVMDIYYSAFLAFLAFAVTAAAIRLLIPYASQLGLLENPGGHRGHAEPTPMVGGAAIFFGLMAGLVVLGGWSSTTAFYACGAAVLMLIGYLDDRHLIPIGLKAAGQLFAAGLLCIGGQVVIRNMGNLLGLGDIYLSWAAWPFTIFAIVGLINAVNMLDGMDGGLC